MEYKTYKIFDPQVNDIAVGVHMADCMMSSNSDENEPNFEDYVCEKIQDLTISTMRSCTVCRVSFDDVVEQRKHYKLDWHRYNLKRSLIDRHPVTEEVFESLADDVSSISASENESSDNEESDSESNDLKGKKLQSDRRSQRGRHSKAFFQNSENKIFSVYKCLLLSKKEASSSTAMISAFTKLLMSPKKWLVIMLGGGHFAAAIFNNAEIAEHKTFHCYTVRSKQGGSQCSRDSRGGGYPKSAGASLRRYNEQALTQHVQKILHSWAESLKDCQLMFYRAAGRYNRGVIFGGKNPGLDKTDPRLRNIPFPTRRATFSEVKRVHDILSTLEVYGSADVFKDCYPRSPDKRVEGEASADNTENNDKKKKKGSPQKFDRSKERSSPERELPGGYINKMCGSDSSDVDSDDDNDDYFRNPKQKDEFWCISVFEESNFHQFKEYDQSVSRCVTDSDDSVSARRKKGGGMKTTYDLQFESIQKKLINSCMRRDKAALIQTLKVYDTLPDKIEEGSEGGYLWTKEDFMKCLNDDGCNSNNDTVLHLAASHALPEFTKLLLEAGADPTIKNKYRFTPYVMSGSKETKRSFKRFSAKYPDRIDWRKAGIPEPLTLEMRREREERRREKNRLRRQKERLRKKEEKKEEKKKVKEKAKEEREREKFLALSDTEKRALNDKCQMPASEEAGSSKMVQNRCFLCGLDITGKVPFEYGMNRFCSVPCVKAHRAKCNSYGLEL